MSSMMEYNGYHAKIEYDADDNIFIGEVFGIVDSLNFHGSSIEELEEMFHQSIDNYLNMCFKCGKEPDKEFKGTFNVRIPSNLHRKIALEAVKRNCNLNQYVIKALEKSFDETGTKETIIYMPYSYKDITWDANRMDYNNSSYFIDLITNKREELCNVGN